MVEQLEASAVSELEELAKVRTNALEVRKVVESDGAPVQVHVLRTGAGVARLRYSYAGVRMERGTLQALVCSEQACPERTAVRSRWSDRAGIQAGGRREEPRTKCRASLFEEVAIQVGPRIYVARPAALRCRTSCPEGAHAPLVLDKQGWDLFAGGRYVEGGLVQAAGSSDQVPMFPTIDHARAWLEVNGDVRHRQSGVK